jgi:acetyl-CoA C-acetyltransferase
LTSSYIVAARRTALGRVGGLHRNRRIDELAAPVVRAALEDCGVSPETVDEIIIGNASEGGNPARLIALAAGLPERVAASTVDRQCGSGLDAIVSACRTISAGDADVIVAGGAESLSTAPWRIAKPKSLYQTPHFMRIEPGASDTSEEPQLYEASEQLSRRLSIGRMRQDAYAVRARLKAEAARSAKRFVGEIVPLRGNAEEARDESSGEIDPVDLERMAPFVAPDGTLTQGNTAAMHDGAAFVVIVSEKVWQRLKKPKALRLVAGVIEGVAPENEAGAPMEALRKLYTRLEGFNPKDIGIVEMSETSAAQALALADTFGFDDDLLNPDGGALVRGHPLGAASAVLVVRLFTRMVRAKDAKAPKHGVATLGAIGGMGLAALFQST